ncbi:MAG: ComEC family competence protein, partial [Flavobacteriaceae bacterium]|nr:ComEC family competence protein [Muriicola sp.]NNL40052.1 ComEC family competence protein [Flavobacteriaceae bacterium]
MKPLEFVSVKFSIGLLLGISFGWLFPISQELAILLSTICLIVTLLFFLFENYRKGIYFGVAALLSFVSLGIVAITLAQPKLSPHHYSRDYNQENGFWVIELREVLKPTDFNRRYLFQVLTLNDSATSGLFLGSVQKDDIISDLKVNDRLLYYGKAHPISPPLNPYQFTYDSYMESKGVYDQIYLNPGNSIQLETTGKSLKGWAAQLQLHIKKELSSTPLGTKEQGVLRAILLGQRNDLDPEVYQSYKDAGAVHILAVSGLHVGILLLIIQFFLKPLMYFRFGRSTSMIVTLLILWIYALFTGVSPSVVRAVAMFSFITYALYLNRPTAAVNILALSFLAILLIQPKFLFQVGFQLSYSAVFAIGWIYPLLIRFWRPRNGFIKPLWKLFAVSLSAQLGVLPLCLFYFHQFPGAFLLSSMLIIPFLGILLGLGILLVLLASLKSLPDSLALVYNQMIRTMNELIEYIASQENFIIRQIPMDRPGMILLSVIIILLVLSLQKKKFVYLCFLGISIAGFQVWNLYLLHLNGQKDEVIIMHQVTSTALLYQKGHDLFVLTNDSVKIKTLVENFELNRRIHSTKSIPVPNSFYLGQDQWILIDSSGVLPPVQKNIRGLILTQSPRIHLGRILEQSCPDRIIADGSNYPDDIRR